MLLGCPCWLQYLEHIGVVGLLLELADSELSISVGSTGGNFERVSQHEGVVLTAGHLHEVFVAVQRCHLSCVDALHLVIGVAELAFGGEAPGGREVLLLLLLRGRILLMVLGCGR